MTKFIYAIIFIFLVMLYGYYEYDMYSAIGGLGLGVYIIYLITLFVHSILLITIYMVRRFRKQEGVLFFYSINAFLIVSLLFRLLVFI